jgi:hypothetical protein
MSDIQSMLERMSALLDEERRCVESGQLTRLDLIARRKVRLMSVVEKALAALSGGRHPVRGYRDLPESRDALIASLKILKKKQDENAAVVIDVLSRASAQMADTRKLKVARASYVNGARRLSTVDRST